MTGIFPGFSISSNALAIQSTKVTDPFQQHTLPDQSVKV